jgi:hypothetical protein
MNRLIFSLFALLALPACGGQSLSALTTATQGRSVAVVSLSVMHYGRWDGDWERSRTSPVMTGHAAAMVQAVEQQFASHWQVIPAPSFVGRAEYQALAGPARPVVVPYLPQGYMPLFGQTRADMVATRIAPEVARSLARVAGADLIAVVYSEWGVKTGSMIPTSKALSKNVLSIYDATGVEVYHGRRNIVGENTIGAFGSVTMDDDTILEWVHGFERGIAELLAR